MPRLVDALPKYRKHKASGQAVVTLNGRDCYLGPYGTQASKAFYDRLIAEWLIQGRRAPEPKIEEITGTVPAIKSATKYLREWYGWTPTSDFGPLALKAIRQKMVEDGLSRTYVNSHVACIKRRHRPDALKSSRKGLQSEPRR